MVFLRFIKKLMEKWNKYWDEYWDKWEVKEDKYKEYCFKNGFPYNNPWNLF